MTDPPVPPDSLPSWAPPPTPGWPATAPAPYGTPPGAPQPWQAPPRTNGLAISSLILGCAPVLFWPFALFSGIAAIITGHIARRQIRRTGERGSGLALAGLILGYLSVVVWALLLTGVLLFVFALAPNLAQDQARHDARAFGEATVYSSVVLNQGPRDADVVRAAYYQERRDYQGCCERDRVTLADGTPIAYATDADYERNNWRLQLSTSVLWTRYACLTVPEARNQVSLVVDGRCNS